MSEDGRIEAVSGKGPTAFAVGGQWFPEYPYLDRADYNVLIGAFHEASKES